MDKRVRYSKKQVLDWLQFWQEVFQEAYDHPLSESDSLQEWRAGRIDAVKYLIFQLNKGGVV